VSKVAALSLDVEEMLEELVSGLDRSFRDAYDVTNVGAVTQDRRSLGRV